MSIDFKGIPQYIDANGNPRLGGFKYYGQPGLVAEENPKSPFSDSDLQVPASAEQALNDLGQVSIQLFLSGFYSTAVYTEKFGEPGAVLVERTDFIGVASTGGGGTDRVQDNINDTTVIDEAGTRGLVVSATNPSSLQYIDVLAMRWDATERVLFRPDGTTNAIFIGGTSLLIKSPDGVNAINIIDDNTDISAGANLDAIAVGVSSTILQTPSDHSALIITDVNTTLSNDTKIDVLSGADMFLSAAANVTLQSTAGFLTINSSSRMLLNSSADIDLTSTTDIRLLATTFVNLVGTTTATLNAQTGDTFVSSSLASVNIDSETFTSFDVNNVQRMSLTELDLNFFTGVGVNFGDDSLNFYKVGDFTPTMQDNSLSNGEGQTYTIQRGRFVKLGRLVIATGTIQMLSLGTLNAIDPANLAGFPFTSENLSNSNAVLSVSGITPGGIGPGTSLGVNGVMAPNTTFVALRFDIQSASHIVSSGVRITDLLANTGFSFSIMYITAS